MNSPVSVWSRMFRVKPLALIKADAENPEHRLKRTLSVTDLTSLGIGAIIGTKLFALMRIKDDSIKGMAMGITAHGIGTARAFQVSPEMGAFSGLAMALSAFATAVILPWLLNLVGMLG